MSLLYEKDWTITLDTIQVKGLRCTFSVKRSLKVTANTVDLKVYSLNPTHRKALETPAQITVQIDAGYKDPGAGTIFKGDVRTHRTLKEGSEMVTHVGAGDGEKALQTKRVSLSLGKGSTPQQVLSALAAALGVDPGNVAEAAAKLAPFAGMFSMGTVLSGSAQREMTRVLKSCGFTWSIQNGKLQVLGLKDALIGSAILLAPEKGLIGSPSIDKDGFLNANSLMIPDLFPGRLLVLNARSVQGNFRVEETEHKGDTHGQEWDVAIKAKPF